MCRRAALLDFQLDFYANNHQHAALQIDTHVPASRCIGPMSTAPKFFINSTFPKALWKRLVIRIIPSEPEMVASTGVTASKVAFKLANAPD